MLLIFVALIPFGLFFLAFLPLCMKCKWMKDIEHIDPATGNTVGIYRRGVRDAPSVYTYYRHPDGVTGETVTQQPIPLHIVFRDRPVKLPDGVCRADLEIIIYNFSINLVNNYIYF